MELQLANIGEMKHPDDVDRIALEHLRVGEIDAALVLEKVQRARDLAGTAGKAADDAGQPGSLLGLLVLKPGAEDPGEIADILGDKKIVLHEAFDRRQAGMILIAEALGDIALDIEGEPLLGLAGEKCMWQRTAHRKSSAFSKRLNSRRDSTPSPTSSSVSRMW
jgi:hypothetical protein